MLGTNGVMALLPGIEKKEQALTITTTPHLPGESERIDHAVMQNHRTAGHSAS
jgi:hypothetical protein